MLNDYILVADLLIRRSSCGSPVLALTVIAWKVSQEFRLHRHDCYCVRMLSYNNCAETQQTWGHYKTWTLDWNMYWTLDSVMDRVDFCYLIE